MRSVTSGRTAAVSKAGALIAFPAFGHPENHIPMKTILCPTDFSPGARLALKYAWEIARRSHATLIMQHVYHVRPLMPYARMYEAPEIVFDQAQVLLKKMEELREELLQGRGNSSSPWR
jgi:ribosomal 50S subunit-associated protein YjgA (DUF615 family)